MSTRTVHPSSRQAGPAGLVHSLFGLGATWALAAAVVWWGLFKLFYLAVVAFDQYAQDLISFKNLTGPAQPNLDGYVPSDGAVLAWIALTIISAGALAWTIRFCWKQWYTATDEILDGLYLVATAGIWMAYTLAWSSLDNHMQVRFRDLLGTLEWEVVAGWNFWLLVFFHTALVAAVMFGYGRIVRSTKPFLR